MSEKSDYKRILTGNEQLGPYPMERLKRVDRPTTRITENIQRFDEREHGFNQAARGDFGPIVARERPRFVMKQPICATLVDMTTYFAPVVDGETADSKALIPEEPAILSRHIKRLSYFLGADIVGICRLPQYAVYSHDKGGNPVELDHEFAIVVLVDQDYETMKSSTGSDWISDSQSFKSYSNTAYISCILANYIRRLGYAARAHHARNNQLVFPPLLLQAGLGEVSRPGIILNPFLGLRFKAAAVTTDLPLLPDRPVDFGLQEFCQQCDKCAGNCPPQAISHGDKVMHNGYEIWKLDYERCIKFRIANQNGAGCGRCIKVCPWNKPKGRVHDVVRWMVQHTPWLDKSLIKMNDVLGYGKQDTRNKWWFDLTEVDGILQAPGGNRSSSDKEIKPEVKL